MTLPYQVISSEENPLLHTFGSACPDIEVYVYHFMTKMAGKDAEGNGLYSGGMWEFRKYPNGALMMVFPDTETIIDPVTLNGNYVTCSLEALSCAVWLIVLGMTSMELSNKKSSLAGVVGDQCHAGLDALCGEYCFKIEEGKSSDITEEEAAAMNPVKYKEISAIISIID